jgi:hypothetical protein
MYHLHDVLAFHSGLKKTDVEEVLLSFIWNVINR